mgnify:CR=1 FL=1
MENTGDHIGLVTSVSDGTARIRFLRGSACAHCGACLTVGDSAMEISLPNTLGAKEGDRVAVDLSPKRVVQASLIAYAVPLVLLIAGVLTGIETLLPYFADDLPRGVFSIATMLAMTGAKVARVVAQREFKDD